MENEIECSHTNIYDGWCGECGEHFNNSLSPKDTSRCVSSEGRCWKIKRKSRSVRDIIGTFDISSDIISKTEELYNLVSSNKIFRNNKYRSIVGACLLVASSSVSGVSRITSKRVCEMVGLSLKNISEGLKIVKLELSRVYKNGDFECPMWSEGNIHSLNGPVESIVEMLFQLGADAEFVENIVNKYTSIVKDKTQKINRARPQSVAAGTVFVFSTLLGKRIDMSEFSNQIGLSEVTITRMAREVIRVLKNEPGLTNVDEVFGDIVNPESR